MDNEQFNIIQTKLNEIHKIVGIPKKWLSTEEVSIYTSYSIESIYKKIKDGELKQNIHYYKKERKLLFDILEIDNWITNKGSSNNCQNNNIDKTLEDILSTIAA